ncbi:MAG: GlsB/YeaQ/YmgE family stress response membrane protein [Pirellulaceae bacterium]
MLIPILGFMLFGLLIGAIARALYPGRQSMGLFKTMLLGIAGSFVGGFLGYLIQGGNAIQSAGWFGSLIGAIVLIAIVQSRRDRRMTYNP